MRDLLFIRLAIILSLSNSFLKSTYDIEKILYKLYNSLSLKYDTIIVVFKSQKEKNKDKTLRIL